VNRFSSAGTGSSGWGRSTGTGFQNQQQPQAGFNRTSLGSGFNRSTGGAGGGFASNAGTTTSRFGTPSTGGGFRSGFGTQSTTGFRSGFGTQGVQAQQSTGFGGGFAKSGFGAGAGAGAGTGGGFRTFGTQQAQQQGAGLGGSTLGGGLSRFGANAAGTKPGFSLGAGLKTGLSTGTGTGLGSGLLGRTSTLGAKPSLGLRTGTGTGLKLGLGTGVGSATTSRFSIGSVGTGTTAATASANAALTEAQRLKQQADRVRLVTLVDDDPFGLAQLSNGGNQPTITDQDILRKAEEQQKLNFGIATKSSLSTTTGTATTGTTSAAGGLKIGVATQKQVNFTLKKTGGEAESANKGATETKGDTVSKDASTTAAAETQSSAKAPTSLPKIGAKVDGGDKPSTSLVPRSSSTAVVDSAPPRSQLLGRVRVQSPVAASPPLFRKVAALSSDAASHVGLSGRLFYGPGAGFPQTYAAATRAAEATFKTPAETDGSDVPPSLLASSMPLAHAQAHAQLQSSALAAAAFTKDILAVTK